MFNYTQLFNTDLLEKVFSILGLGDYPFHEDQVQILKKKHRNIDKISKELSETIVEGLTNSLDVDEDLEAEKEEKDDMINGLIKQNSIQMSFYTSFILDSLFKKKGDNKYYIDVNKYTQLIKERFKSLIEESEND